MFIIIHIEGNIKKIVDQHNQPISVERLDLNRFFLLYLVRILVYDFLNRYCVGLGVAPFDIR